MIEVAFVNMITYKVNLMIDRLIEYKNKCACKFVDTGLVRPKLNTCYQKASILSLHKAKYRNKVCTGICPCII